MDRKTTQPGRRILQLALRDAIRHTEIKSRLNNKKPGKLQDELVKVSKENLVTNEKAENYGAIKLEKVMKESCIKSKHLSECGEFYQSVPFKGNSFNDCFEDLSNISDGKEVNASAIPITPKFNKTDHDKTEYDNFFKNRLVVPTPYYIPPPLPNTSNFETIHSTCIQSIKKHETEDDDFFRDGNIISIPPPHPPHMSNCFSDNIHYFSNENVENISLLDQQIPNSVFNNVNHNALNNEQKSSGYFLNVKGELSPSYSVNEACQNDDLITQPAESSCINKTPADNQEYIDKLIDAIFTDKIFFLDLIP